MAAGIATIDELRVQLSDREGRTDEGLLRQLLDGATDLVQRYTGRLFVPDPSPDLDDDSAPMPTRRVRVDGVARARIPDCRDLEEVEHAGRPVGVRHLERLGEQPAHAVVLTEAIDGELLLFGRWGWNPVPASVKDATLVLAARNFHERQQRFGDQAVDPDGTVSSYFRSMPPRVRAALDLFRLPSL